MLNTIVQALSGLLSATIGAMFALVIFRGGKRADAARERLDKVYLKAFRLIEPVMYQNISRKKCDWLVSQLHEITVAGGILADPQLLDALEHYQRSPAGDESDYPNFKYSFFNPRHCYLTCWCEICRHIDQNYDILCRQAFLPIRSLSYRLNRNQYINRFTWFINLLRFTWTEITVLLVCLIFFLTLQLLPMNK